MVDLRPYQHADLDAVPNLMAQLQGNEMQFSAEHLEPTPEWVDGHLSGVLKNVEAQI